MEDSPRDPAFTSHVRTMQIVVAAMAAGALFYGVMSVVISSSVADPNAEPLLSLISLGAAMVSIATWLIVPQVVANQALRGLAVRETNVSTEALLSVLQNRLILGSAILEGAAFFVLLAYMLDGRLWSLAVAAVLVVCIIAGFPTRDGAEQWIARQRRAIDEKSSLGRGMRR